MSDDEDEGRLQIDESPPEEKKDISRQVEKVVEPEPPAVKVKEEGELDEDDEEPMETQSSKIIEEKAEEKVREETPVEEKEKKTAENGSMKPPQSAEKTPSRKRKESTEPLADKRKSGLETITSASSPTSTPQRSKRASSHMATVAISACFNEEDIVSVPMMPIQRTPDTGTNKRAKRDMGTNVITTKSLDTVGLLNSESILDAPPGSQMLLEVTVMYRTRGSIAFRVKGSEIFGFVGDGLPPMAAVAANASATVAGNNNNKKKNNLDEKDGRMSSASNGRSTRGGSAVQEGKSEKTSKKEAKRRREEETEEVEDENQSTLYGSRKCELREIELNNLHDCHFDGCEKRFHRSLELEYHIAKNHKKRVMMYESICTQTEASSFKTKNDVGTEIDEDLAPTPQMPVLKKEMPGPSGLVYEDLSDDELDHKPPESLLKTSASTSALSSSATAALMGIVQSTSSNSASATPMRSTTSTPAAAKIGIAPSMMAQINAQNEKNKQKSAFSLHSPRPSSSASTSQPAPVIHPMQQFLGPPPFHPSLMHPQMAALMDPRAAAAMQQQQQQRTTPSRQTNDSHKIHELAKAKESEQRQRTTPKSSQAPAGGISSAGSTPQRQFMPPHLMQNPGTPQNVQQQQQQQQQQQAMMQLQMQMQAAQRGMIPPQPEILMMMMGMPQFPMPPGAAPGFPSTPQPPK